MFFLLFSLVVAPIQAVYGDNLVGLGIKPTTYSVMPQPFDGGGRGFVYVRNFKNTYLRELAEVYCSPKTDDIQLVVQQKGDIPNFFYIEKRGGKNCQETARDYTSLPLLGADTEFDERDFNHISRLNKLFYKKTNPFGTLTFQHGRITDKVYVFLPGLFMHGRTHLWMARTKFAEGSNIILGTLPGHENDQIQASENKAESWLEYSIYLVRMARSYGHRVIVVGHSLGGSLAIRTAELGLVDGLILFQPFLALTAGIRATLNFSKVVSKPMIDWNAYGSKVAEAADLGREAAKLVAEPFKQLDTKITVEMTVALNDSIVSPEAALNWANKFAPRTSIVRHYNRRGHMFMMPVRAWLQ
jgi:pimeloyl-ACP methyl ester carboxylesterase